MISVDKYIKCIFCDSIPPAINIYFFIYKVSYYSTYYTLCVPITIAFMHVIHISFFNILQRAGFSN